MAFDDEPSPVDLRLSEVPVCFGELARHGNTDAVISSGCLVAKLARFGCVADCENCVVSDALTNGIESVADSLDEVALGIVRAVNKIRRVGLELIGRDS